MSLFERLRKFPAATKKVIDDYFLLQTIRDTAANPRTSWKGVVPRSEVRRIARIQQELRTVVPIVAFAVLPVVGNVPMVLAALQPKYLLTSQFHNEFEKIRYKELAFERRGAYQNEIRDMLSGDGPLSERVAAVFPSMETLTTKQTVALAMAFGAGDQIPFLAFLPLPTSWWRSQVQESIEVVDNDNRALKETGLENVSDAELVDACLMRNVDFVNKSPSHLRARLSEYLEDVDKVGETNQFADQLCRCLVSLMKE